MCPSTTNYYGYPGNMYSRVFRSSEANASELLKKSWINISSVLTRTRTITVWINTCVVFVIIIIDVRDQLTIVHISSERNSTQTYTIYSWYINWWKSDNCQCCNYFFNKIRIDFRIDWLHVSVIQYTDYLLQYLIKRN